MTQSEPVWKAWRSDIEGNGVDNPMVWYKTVEVRPKKNTSKEYISCMASGPLLTKNKEGFILRARHVYHAEAKSRIKRFWLGEDCNIVEDVVFWADIPAKKPPTDTPSKTTLAETLRGYVKLLESTGKPSMIEAVRVSLLRRNVDRVIQQMNKHADALDRETLAKNYQVNPEMQDHIDAGVESIMEAEDELWKDQVDKVLKSKPYRLNRDAKDEEKYGAMLVEHGRGSNRMSVQKALHHARKFKGFSNTTTEDSIWEQVETQLRKKGILGSNLSSEAELLRLADAGTSVELNYGKLMEIKT